MKEIIITEENFEKVLKKILRFTNKYKISTCYSSFDKNMNLKYKNNDIGFKSKHKFVWYSSYFRVTKHLFREKFEQGIQDYDVSIYSKQKIFIHIDMKGGSALVINEGDKILFIPFLGFILWQKEENFIYRYICIIDFIKGKIRNLDKENIIRDEEWDEEARLWNDHYNDSHDFYNDYENDF